MKLHPNQLATGVVWESDPTNLFAARLNNVRFKRQLQQLWHVIGALEPLNEESHFLRLNLARYAGIRETIKVLDVVCGGKLQSNQPTNQPKDGPQVGGTSVKRRRTPTFKWRVRK